MFRTLEHTIIFTIWHFLIILSFISAASCNSLAVNDPRILRVKIGIRFMHIIKLYLLFDYAHNFISMKNIEYNMTYNSNIQTETELPTILQMKQIQKNYSL